MNNEKPKLTKEQALQIKDIAHNTISDRDFLGSLAAYGYMEVPETALERAERLYNEWGKEPSKDEDEEEKINDIIDAFREVIAELTETIKHTQVG